MESTETNLHEQHFFRTAQYMAGLQRVLIVAGFSEYSKFCQSDILMCGIAHDTGKLFIPRQILDKCGPLTDAEREIMGMHPVYGAAALAKYSRRIKSLYPEFPLKLACITAAMHHERVDGQGYPAGIQGSALPEIARLCAVADTFDAMTGPRIYRNCATIDEALLVLQSVAGTQLDKKIVTVAVADQSWIDLARGIAIPSQVAVKKLWLFQLQRG